MINPVINHLASIFSWACNKVNAMAIRSAVAFLALSFSAAAYPGDWVVVGAGNATCTHWNAGRKEQQTEVLSWMAGFSSAVNLDRASEGKPEYRLEYLTYDYLRAEVNAVCSDTKNKGQSMSSILFTVLQKLPVQSK